MPIDYGAVRHSHMDKNKLSVLVRARQRSIEFHLTVAHARILQMIGGWVKKCGLSDFEPQSGEK